MGPGGSEARCIVRAPKSTTSSALPVGSQNMSADDTVAPKDGGSSAYASPVRPASARGQSSRGQSNSDQLRASLTPPYVSSLRPRASSEASAISPHISSLRLQQSPEARAADGIAGMAAAPPPGVTQRSSLLATRWSNRLTFTRSNSADWGSIGHKPAVGSTPQASHGSPSLRCVGGEAMVPCMGNVLSDGLSTGVSGEGSASPRLSTRLTPDTPSLQP